MINKNLFIGVLVIFSGCSVCCISGKNVIKKERLSRPTRSLSSSSNVMVSIPNQWKEGIMQDWDEALLWDEYFKKGDEYMSRGLYSQAILQYRNALEYAEKREISADILYAHLILARAYERIGEYVLAIDHVKFIIQHTPSKNTKIKDEEWLRVLEGKIAKN